MARPVLQNVTTFDASKSKDFKFNWYGSSLARCELAIYNSVTDVLTYSATQNIVNNNYTYVLPPDSVSNGNTYYATLVGTDVYGNVSTISNKIIFKCMAMPNFDLTLETEQTINTTAIEFEIMFDHSNDDLKTIQFYLSDDAKNIISESNDITYETEEDLHYRFIGLENNKTYYIFAKCSTIHGFELETPHKRVNVACEQINFGGSFYVQQNPMQNNVKCSTSFIVVQYNGSSEFTYTNGMIDLRDNMLYYDEGFSLSDDFRICLRGNSFQYGQVFLASSPETEISVNVINYDDDTMDHLYIARLLVTVGELKYVIYSNTFDATSSLIQIWITKKNGIFDLEVAT